MCSLLSITKENILNTHKIINWLINKYIIKLNKIINYLLLRLPQNPSVLTLAFWY